VILSIADARSSCLSIVWILLLFTTIGFATMRGLFSKLSCFLFDVCFYYNLRGENKSTEGTNPDNRAVNVQDI